MASNTKNPHLSEVVLANAATAYPKDRRAYLREVTSGGGYHYYRGASTYYPAILRVGDLVPAVPMSPLKIKQSIGAISSDWKSERADNQAIGAALDTYRGEHDVTGSAYDFGRVWLGRAGWRCYWCQFILHIDGKPYLCFIDPRRDDALTYAGRRFTFSLMDTHIRLEDPTKFGHFGLVIFQFDRENPRKVIPRFADGIKLWTFEEIGAMVDDTYRILDDILRGKKAA